MINKFAITVFTAMASVLLQSCIREPATPMQYVTYPNPHATASNKKLMIFLRGLGGSYDIFEKNGIVDTVIEKKLPFIMIAPDAHMGYYKRETFEERLHKDIIVPAKESGYDEIWLVGTSMGGLGCLFYLDDHPREVSGVILLSPFLGWGDVPEEIAKAKGIENWDPGEYTVKDWERYIWAWIKSYAKNPEAYPPIYLGYGDHDFFLDEQRLLAKILPRGRSTEVDGWHTYATLRRLWAHYLTEMGPTWLRPAKAFAPLTISK